MSDKTTTKIPSLRTFADDINSARATSGMTKSVSRSTKNDANVSTSNLTDFSLNGETAILSKTNNYSALTKDSLSKETDHQTINPPFPKFKQIEPVKKSEPEVEINDKIYVEKNKITTDSPKTKLVDEPTLMAKIESIPLTVAQANKESNPAVVITGRKQNRFNLIEAISESVSTWLLERKKKIQENKRPKYTVPKAEIRKGVIQKATAKTALTNTADHSEVINRIREINNLTLQEEITKEAELVNNDLLEQNIQSGLIRGRQINTPRIELRHQARLDTSYNKIEEKPQWESDSKTARNDLSESQINKPFNSFKNKVIENEQTNYNTLNNQEVIQLEINDLPTISPVLPKTNILEKTEFIPEPTIVKENNNTVTPIKITPKNFPKIVPNINSVTPDFGEKTINPILPKGAVVTNDKQTNSLLNANTKNLENKPAILNKSYLEYLSIFKNNKLIISTAGIICFVLFFTFMTVSIYKKNISEPISTNSQQTILNTNLPQNYIFDKNTILGTIQGTTNGDTSFTKLTIIDKKTGLEITDNTLLDNINAKVLIDFRQTITKSTIGGYRGEPWILFSISELSTGFGGMLNWERSISSDLSPWFGPAIISKTTSGLTDFEDQVIEKTDVRVLKDSNGNEKIVYGFISQDKLLITTNTTAFLNIAKTLNNQ